MLEDIRIRITLDTRQWTWYPVVVTRWALVVKVSDYATKLPLFDAQVDAQYGAITKISTTNVAGVATFTVPNKTDIRVSASFPGYSGGTKSVNTGNWATGGSATVSVEIELFKNYVTTSPTTPIPTYCINGVCYTYPPTATPTGSWTTGPGPTTGPTVLPGCEPPNENSPECQASQNNYLMAWMSKNAINLVMLCFVFTMLYIMGWKP
jgi:hypothetical protein